ncbi:MAG: LysR family transcriptional regulator [Comamonadaceae bacterium]|nr:MAG: LysR family transcriptional regulator [Comamonadaceae bacterium]
MSFDLTDLRLVLNTIESGTVTGGGERTSLSSPAASTRLKNLEASLRIKLLYRSHQGVTPTPAGLVFAQYARTALQQIDALAHAMENLLDGLGGHIRVVANTALVNDFMPDVLGEFLLGRPQVSVDLQPRLTSDIVRLLADRQADFAVVATAQAPAGLVRVDLGPDPLVLVTPRGHPLAQAKQVAFEATFEHDFVGLYPGSTMDLHLRDLMKRAGKKLAVRISAPSYEALCRMVEAGLGVGLLPEFVAMRHGGQDPLPIVHLSDAWATRRRYVLYADDASLSPCARSLIEAIKQHRPRAGKD